MMNQPAATIPNIHCRVSVALSAVVALSALLLPSCGKEWLSLPAAPSEVTSGLSVYQHANYQGDSALLTQSIGNLSDYKGPCEQPEGDDDPDYVWDDCISSIRIAPGWRATVYRDYNYKGDSLDVTADMPNLQRVPGSCKHDGMNDCISSIKVTPP